MTLRIAVCGPDIEKNEAVIENIRSLILPFTNSINVLKHSLKSLVDYSEKNEWQIDEMNLYSNVLRALDQVRNESFPVLLSPSCGIDNICSQAAWLAEQAARIEQRSKLLGADGNQIMTKEHVIFNRSGAILQTILNQTEYETIEFWHYVYAIVPNSSTLIQHTNDVLAQYEDFLTTVPAFAKVIRLPEDNSLDALREEVTKWQTYLD